MLEVVQVVVVVDVVLVVVVVVAEVAVGQVHVRDALLGDQGHL